MEGLLLIVWCLNETIYNICETEEKEAEKCYASQSTKVNGVIKDDTH